MNSAKREKIQIVEAIQERIAKASSIAVVNYQGLTVPEMQELSKELNSAECEMKVFKNTLFGIAAKNLKIDLQGKIISGPNAYVFSYGENVTPFKIIAKFAKDHENTSFRAGIFGNKLVSDQEAVEISKLPSKPEALEILARSLMAPVQQMGLSLHLLIKEEKLQA